MRKVIWIMILNIVYNVDLNKYIIKNNNLDAGVGCLFHPSFNVLLTGHALSQSEGMNNHEDISMEICVYCFLKHDLQIMCWVIIFHPIWRTSNQLVCHPCGLNQESVYSTICIKPLENGLCQFKTILTFAVSLRLHFLLNMADLVSRGSLVHLAKPPVCYTKHAGVNNHLNPLPHTVKMKSRRPIV